MMVEEQSDLKAADVVVAKDTVTALAPVGPDESVRITPKDKYANLKDDELQSLLAKMTDIAVKVDENPELEKIFETFGTDQEVSKQEIMDELKRRKMSRKD